MYYILYLDFYQSLRSCLVFLIFHKAFTQYRKGVLITYIEVLYKHKPARVCKSIDTDLHAPYKIIPNFCYCFTLSMYCLRQERRLHTMF